jgi:serine/threonine protein kinase
LFLLTGEEPKQLFDSFSSSWQWTDKAQVSPELTAILNRMLQPTPSDRLGSAQEVLQALNPTVTVPPSSPPSPPSSLSPPSPSSPPPSPPRRRRFSTIELLGNAAFTGFEAGLLVIGLSAVLNSPLVVGVITVIALGSLILAQFRRWIEKADLVIIAGISLALGLILVAGLRSPQVIMMVIFITLGSIAITALFRLIYIILYRLL